MTAQYLRQKYGDLVQVQYIDFANQENREKYASVLEEIKNKRLRFPVTEVDGQFIAEGYVDYWSIANVVEQKLQEQK